LSRTFFRKS